MTGNLPTNSGISPYLIRSLGSHASSMFEGVPFWGFLPLEAFLIDQESHAFLADPAFDQLFQADESAAADKKDICGIDLDKFLMRMLSASLGRHIGYRAFQDLKRACCTPSPIHRA